jgi:hypothetical protein
MRVVRAPERIAILFVFVVVSHERVAISRLFPITVPESELKFVVSVTS